MIDNSSPLEKSIQTNSVWSQFELQCHQEDIHSQQFQEDEAAKLVPSKKRLISSLKRSGPLRPWTIDDEINLITLHKKLGNKWTHLARCYPGMSENSIKNRFYSRLRKSVRKLNKMIDQLKLKQYNKFKLNIIFQLSNISQSKLLEKEKIAPQIFQFYKEFLYELIQFTNQNQIPEDRYKSYDDSRDQVEALLLPLIALQNLFRLVRGERAAKGKKKNIAYLRQFNFRLNLQNSTQIIITKESVYLENYPQLPNISFSQLSLVDLDLQKTTSLITRESVRSQTSIRIPTGKYSFGTEKPSIYTTDSFVEKIDHLSLNHHKQEAQIKPLFEMQIETPEFQMKEYDIFGQEQQFHGNYNSYDPFNVRDIDFSDENGIWGESNF